MSVATARRGPTWLLVMHPSRQAPAEQQLTQQKQQSERPNLHFDLKNAETSYSDETLSLIFFPFMLVRFSDIQD